MQIRKQSIIFSPNYSSLLILFLITITACTTAIDEKTTSSVDTKDPKVAINERARSLELDTKYNPPPGDPLSHHASGFAKILCSAVFITGLDFEFAAKNIGYFTAPYEQRSKFAKREIDMESKAVHVTLPNGVVRTAKYFGDLGCSCLPEGRDKLNFDPPEIMSSLPEASTTPWPMGDKLSDNPLPSNVNQQKVDNAVAKAFEQKDGMTAALIITHKGRIIGEHYKDGIDMHTSLESWSMGKSLTATLLGLLIQDGVYELHQAAPIPEWQGPNDPRAKIKISDILNMSSGLRFRAPQDPDFDPSVGYPDHLYVYTGTVNSFHYSANLPQQWLPGTVGRYRNCDPVLANYLVRLGVVGQGADYHSFPTKALFDKIGIRNLVCETDPYGNFLLQGYEFGSARDWARLGNLYLQDGIWNGERLLPEGFVDFVSTLAPGWKADNRPIYGGFFWLNGDGNWPVPENAYFMAGAGGQFTIIIPSHDLVVVRLGHYKGASKGVEDLKAALEILMEAVS